MSAHVFAVHVDIGYVLKTLFWFLPLRFTVCVLPSLTPAKSIMAKQSATQTSQDVDRRRDDPEGVQRKNEEMRAAWELGRDLVERLGMRADYGSMLAEADFNLSQAEKLRKYRGMANRISEQELNRICKLCVANGRAWGPTYLVTLSRLGTPAERRRMAKMAIAECWGIKSYDAGFG